MEDKKETQLDRVERIVKQLLLIQNGNGKIGQVAKVQIMWCCSIFVVCGTAAALIKSFIF